MDMRKRDTTPLTKSQISIMGLVKRRGIDFVRANHQKEFYILVNKGLIK